MSSNSNGQNVKDALQRLLDGLQRTIQTFKVFSVDDIESGNDAQRRDIFRRTHSSPWLDRTTYNLEKELESYEYEPTDLRVMYAERQRPPHFKEKMAGPSSNHPRFIKPRPGEKITFAEQELYSTSVHKPQNRLQDARPSSKRPAKNKPTCCRIEEVELSDRILVRCVNHEENIKPNEDLKRWSLKNLLHQSKKQADFKNVDKGSQTEAVGMRFCKGCSSGLKEKFRGCMACCRRDKEAQGQNLRQPLQKPPEKPITRSASFNGNKGTQGNKSRQSLENLFRKPIPSSTSFNGDKGTQGNKSRQPLESRFGKPIPSSASFNGDKGTQSNKSKQPLQNLFRKPMPRSASFNGKMVDVHGNGKEKRPKTGDYGSDSFLDKGSYDDKAGKGFFRRDLSEPNEKSEGCLACCRRGKKNNDRKSRQPFDSFSDTEISDTKARKSCYRRNSSAPKEKSEGCLACCRRGKDTQDRKSRQPLETTSDSFSDTEGRTDSHTRHSSDQTKKSEGCFACCRKGKKAEARKSDQSLQTSRRKPIRRSVSFGEADYDSGRKKKPTRVRTDDQESDSSSGTEGRKDFHTKNSSGQTKKSEGCLACCRKGKKSEARKSDQPLETSPRKPIRRSVSFNEADYGSRRKKKPTRVRTDDQESDSFSDTASDNKTASESKTELVGCCKLRSPGKGICCRRKHSSERSDASKEDKNSGENEGLGDFTRRSGRPRKCFKRNKVKSPRASGEPEDIDRASVVCSVLSSDGSVKGCQTMHPDFVLVFSMKADAELGDILRYFVENLEKEGILVESVTKNDFEEPFAEVRYVKVQIPKERVLRLANTYDVKLTCNNPYYEQESAAGYFCLNSNLTSPNPTQALLIRNRDSVKDVQPKEPTSAERIMVLYEIMRFTKFGEAPEDAGVQELKRQRIVDQAYPVHDGTVEWAEKGPLNDCQLLKACWCTMSSIFKVQPIQHIHKYFGPEAAFYFALMGFYISLLIPLALAGMIPIIYGVITYGNAAPIKDFCASDLLICPLCKYCNFGSVKGACFNSKVMWVLDNSYTMVFAAIMSVWGIIFILLWRINENSLKVSWNLHRCFKAELTPRPRFYKKPQRLLPSLFSKEEEPSPSMKQHLVAWLGTVVVILAVLLLVLLIGFIIIMCRIKIINFLANRDCKTWSAGAKTQVCNRGRAHRFAAWATALMTSGAIIILDPWLDRLAIFLANVHNPRTQMEFDQLCIVFVYILSCVNNYPPALYMAFFRGFTSTHPGDDKMWDSFFGINRDQCAFAGCTLELAILLTMIFSTKAIRNIFKRRMHPSWLVRRRKVPASRPEWELDAKLKPISEQYFTKLNVELIIQYGFVISFLPAFTLLPLVALICSAIELRLNALELVRFYQRPVPRQTVRDRKTWNNILYVQTFAGVIVHAYTSAFTVEFIMQQLHKSRFHQYNLEDYFNVWQSIFDTRGSRNFSGDDGTTCRYKYSLRNGASENYSFKEEHYNLNSNRLHLVTIVPALIFIIAAILFNTLPKIRSSLRRKVEHQEKIDMFG